MNPEEFEVKSMESAEPPEGSDDEDSFVVLEPSASLCETTTPDSLTGEVLTLFRTNKVREMKNLISSEISQIGTAVELEEPAVDGLDTVASSVAKITISPESSYEEIQKQVEELIKDNEKLKTTIAQTNVNMKKQYGQFVTYKDDVTNVMKSYKEKFIEAKMCIEKYKEENAKLADDVEGYIDIKKLQEEEIMNLKKKINKLEGSTYMNVKTGESISTIDNEKNIELQTELATAKLKITDLEAEKTQLKEELQKLTNKIASLETTLKESAENYDAVQEHNVKLSTELTLMRQNLDKLTEKMVHAPKFENQVQTKVEQINVLQFEISNLQSNIRKLEKENIDLKTNLKTVLEESERHLETINKNAENVAKITALEEELQTVKIERDSARHDVLLLQRQYPNIEEDCSHLRKQLSIAQQTITELGVEQDKKVAEIEKLRKLLQDTENDEIFALKEQLELHKSDFEAERESKTSIKRERDQIAEDLKNLQKRNQQLQNEIETIRARIQPKPEGYTCPKCNFGFTTYQSLENHVHRCLDLDGFP